MFTEMDGMEWMISTVPRDNNGFTIFLKFFYNMLARRVFTIVLQ